jgi:hypothetical protein
VWWAHKTTGLVTFPYGLYSSEDIDIASGKVYKINGTQIALNDLGDVVTGALTNGYVLTYSSGSGKWAAAAPTGGGASAFIDLTDVPANYTSASGKFVKVKADESGLEFVASSVAGHDILSASHTDSTAGAVVAGDLIYGDNTPKWVRLAHGSDGDVLTLASGLPSWAAPAGGGGAHALLSATHSDTLAAAVARGSLVYGNATPKWAALAVGSAGQVITTDGTDAAWGAVPTHASRHQSGGADAIKLDDLSAPDNNADLNVSTTAHGLCPIAPNLVGKFLRGDATWDHVLSMRSFMVTGRYYSTGITNGTLSSSNWGADYIRAIPFICGATTTFDRVGIHVTAGAAAGRYIRLGIYSNDDARGATPGALLQDFGALEITSNAFLYIDAIGLTLTPGLYWLAMLPSYTSISLRTEGNNMTPIVFGRGENFSAAYPCYYTTSQAYGALPNPHPAPGIGSGTAYPIIGLRKSA